MSVETYQVQWELDLLVGMVRALEPRSILEVGCWKGGTLRHWLAIADKVVAVDDAMRDAEKWRQWADDEPTALYLVQGNSNELGTAADVREHGPFDFIFIDADHTYEGVTNDFLNYSPMLTPSGCIAFHDILPRPGYGVAQVWNDIKTRQGVRYVEIAKNATEPGNEGPCGIGVAWLP